MKTYGLTVSMIKIARLNMRWGCHHDDQMARLKAQYEYSKLIEEGQIYGFDLAK